MKSKLDKGIIYATGALFLDVVIGDAIGGKSLHEMAGLDAPNYVQAIETLILGCGIGYTVLKPLMGSKPIDERTKTTLKENKINPTVKGWPSGPFAATMWYDSKTGTIYSFSDGNPALRDQTINLQDCEPTRILCELSGEKVLPLPELEIPKSDIDKGLETALGHIKKFREE